MNTSLVKAKICGITDKKALAAAVEHGADYIGFVFFSPSPRDIAPARAATLAKEIPQHVKTVAVMVEPSDEELEELFAKFTPNYLQLHGNESVQRLSEIREKFNVRIIKAITVRSGDDIATAAAYGSVADMLLFDAKAPESNPLPGGNGLSFDWHLLADRRFDRPWVLSGGLSAENVAEAVRITGARLVDVSSSIETAPGEKDATLIEAFLKKVKALV
jgi:phosphoribosylanthranilate isomerase